MGVPWGKWGVTPTICLYPYHCKWSLESKLWLRCSAGVWSGVCENGGTCIDGLDTYSCRCPAGFTGASCETEIDECASQPCMNNATCHDYVDSFVCECVRGFSGRYCQRNDDDCTARSETPVSLSTSVYRGFFCLSKIYKYDPSALSFSVITYIQISRSNLKYHHT